MPSPSNIEADSGTVCYRNVPGASFGVDTCVSYGPFTANGPLPITGSLSLKQTGGPFDLNQS